MPLRKFDDRDFDSFVRAKFEAAPPATFDAKAWGKLNATRGGFKAKLWIAGITAILLLLAGLWWWYPYGSQSVNESAGDLQEISQRSQQNIDDALLSNQLNHSGDVKTTYSSQNQASTAGDNQQKLSLGGSNLENNSGQNQEKSTEDNKVQEKAEENKSYHLQTVESNVSKNAYKSSKTTVAKIQSTRASAGTGNFSNADANDISEEKEREKIGNLSDQVTDSNTNSKVVKQAFNPNTLVPKPIRGGDGDAVSNLEDNIEQASYAESSAMTDERINTEHMLKYLFFRDTTFAYPLAYEPIEQRGFPYYQADDSETEIAENEEKTNLLKNRFILSLLLNADLSTVKFDDFTNPGFGLGFRISYRITDRIMVNGGITKTTKIYDVNDREDYSLSPWILANQGWPESISAKCNITEIPIGIRYDLVRQQNWNLYGQLSSSTFLMDREIYDFQLTEAQQQAGSRDRWEVENRSKHAFNIVGATVGYERYLTRRLGVGLEVYWQTTLNGIGIYTVNLNSVGNQIMLNYRF